MNTPLLRTFVTLALLAALGRPAAATDPGEALVFPGCGKTIQQCIDAAPDGGIVLLATDDTIDGDVTITRSVALAAAPGFRPVLSPASNIFARSAGGGDKFLVIRGLTWEPAGASTAIRVLHDGDGAYDVLLLDNAILGLQGSGFSSVISVQTTQPGPGGPLLLNVRGNTLRLPPGSRWPLEIELPWTVNGITFRRGSSATSCAASTAACGSAPRCTPSTGRSTCSSRTIRSSTRISAPSRSAGATTSAPRRAA